MRHFSKNYPRMGAPDITLTLPPRLKVTRGPWRLKSVIRLDKIPVPI